MTITCMSWLAFRDEKGDDTGTSQVYIWQGYKDVSPRTFPSLEGIPIHHVSVGWSHCAFLTLDGQLYMHGENSHGQLGNNTFTDSPDQPVLVTEFSGMVYTYYY